MNIVKMKKIIGGVIVALVSIATMIGLGDGKTIEIANIKIIIGEQTSTEVIPVKSVEVVKPTTASAKVTIPTTK